MKGSRQFAIIMSGNPTWTSCKFIVSNLQAAYAIALPEAHLFHFGLEMIRDDSKFDDTKLWRLASSIFELRPAKVIFIDHAPHPLMLLNALVARYGSAPLPDFCFHLYGDFTFHAASWTAIAPLLRKANVQFISASLAQAKLISNFLVTKVASDVCHFPIDEKKFCFDAKERDVWRNKLGLNDEFAIIYTGRISMQKNSIRLLDEFARFAFSSSRKVRLILAGIPDSIDSPMFGIESCLGRFTSEWMRRCDELSELKIIQLGFIDHASLRGVYNAADLYMSLSTHHDEDYGMAVAEALASGTRALTTRWGGYSFFNKLNPKICRNIPVTLLPEGLSFDSEDIQKQLNEIVNEKFRPRIETSHFFGLELGISKASSELRRIHSSKTMPFDGFNKRLSLLSHHLMQNPKILYPAKGNDYEHIWKPYYECD